MEFLFNFILIFILVYLFFYFISVRKARKNSKRVPVEVQYLLLRYQIDLKKIRYKKFVNSVALVGSLDIALVGSLVLLVNGIFFQLCFGFLLFIPVILLSFHLLGTYYQKKANVGEEINQVEEMEVEKTTNLEKGVIKEKKKQAKGERRNG